MWNNIKCRDNLTTTMSITVAKCAYLYIWAKHPMVLICNSSVLSALVGYNQARKFMIEFRSLQTKSKPFLMLATPSAVSITSGGTGDM